MCFSVGLYWYVFLCYDSSLPLPVWPFIHCVGFFFCVVFVLFWLFGVFFFVLGWCWVLGVFFKVRST